MYLPENVLTFSSQGKTFQCRFKTPPHPDYSLITDLSGSQSAWASGLLVGIVAKYSGLFPDPPSQNVGRSPGIPYEQALQVRLMHSHVGILVYTVATNCVIWRPATSAPNLFKMQILTLPSTWGVQVMHKEGRDPLVSVPSRLGVQNRAVCSGVWSDQIA